MVKKPEEEELYFRARATNVQVQAIGHFLRDEIVYSQLRIHLLSNPFKLAATRQFANIGKWFSNAWNTERLLRFQLAMPQEAKHFAVQWAFHQAYYACYCQILALFSAIGLTEIAHTATIKKFGQLASEKKLPTCIGMFADGPMYKIALHGVKKGQYPSPLYLELDEPSSVENQIAQLLCSTREKALKEKKDRMGNFFKTKNGKTKKKLTPNDWEKVSEKLGPTTILGYLYRKRIKANYQEIDSLLQKEIDGDLIIGGLVSTVNAFSAFCEGHIFNLLPSVEKERFYAHAFAKEEFLKNRIEAVWV